MDLRIFGLPVAFRFGLANEGMFSFSFSSRSAMLIEALPDIFVDISVCRSWILSTFQSRVLSYVTLEALRDCAKITATLSSFRHFGVLFLD